MSEPAAFVKMLASSVRLEVSRHRSGRIINRKGFTFAVNVDVEYTKGQYIVGCSLR